MVKMSCEYTARFVSLERNEKGYGFNLHGEKGQFGQYIRAVDEGSPSEICGLKPGDRVVEVDGVNVERETHTQVVARIRGDGVKNITTLLVVDDETDRHFINQGVTITMAQTQAPAVNGDAVDAIDVELKKEDESPVPVEEEEEEEDAPPSDEHDADDIVMETPDTPPPPVVETEPDVVVVAVEEPTPEPPAEIPPPPPEAEPEPPQPTPASTNPNALDLTDLKAARERATKKRKDPASKMDWKEKHKAFEKL